MSGSTLNAVPFRSTIFYTAAGTPAALGTVFTVGANGIQSTTNALGLQSLLASTMTASTVSFSTMTASTILTQASTITLAQNVNVPNRFVEIGCDLANSMYFDFHSSDAALPDYSTRIISQGGATTGTGALNMYASTIGLVATNGVGIGTTVPSATFDVYNNGGASGTTQANITNFAGGSTTTNSSALNLRIQGAGGGMVDNYISAQYNSSGAGTYSIALKPGGTTTMTAVGNGNVGIGTTVPTSNLQIYGMGGASSTTTFTITNSSNSNTGYGAQLLFNNIAGANTFSLAQISALRDNNAGNYGAYMAFYTTNGDVNSTFGERMRISPSGNVGIGTTVPQTGVHVRTFTGYSSAGQAAIFESALGAVNKEQRLTILINNNDATGGSATGSYSAIQSAMNNVANTPLVLQPNGSNVGIGITNPSYNLHVPGSIGCGVILTTSLSFTASALSTVLIANTSSNGYAGNTVIMITVNALNVPLSPFGGSSVTATAYVAWCGNQPSYANVYGLVTTQGTNISISGVGYGVNLVVASTTYYLNYYVTILRIS